MNGDGGPRVPVIYTDDINCQVTTHDFCLSFNLMLPTNRLGGKLQRADMPIVPKALVYMSPTQAKALRDLLSWQVENYEEAHSFELPTTFTRPPKESAEGDADE